MSKVRYIIKPENAWWKVVRQNEDGSETEMALTGSERDAKDTVADLEAQEESSD